MQVRTFVIERHVGIAKLAFPLDPQEYLRLDHMKAILQENIRKSGNDVLNEGPNTQGRMDFGSTCEGTSAAAWASSSNVADNEKSGRSVAVIEGASTTVSASSSNGVEDEQGTSTQGATESGSSTPVPQNTPGAVWSSSDRAVNDESKSTPGTTELCSSTEVTTRIPAEAWTSSNSVVDDEQEVVYPEQHAERHAPDTLHQADAGSDTEGSWNTNESQRSTCRRSESDVSGDRPIHRKKNVLESGWASDLISRVVGDTSTQSGPSSSLPSIPIENVMY